MHEKLVELVAEVDASSPCTARLSVQAQSSPALMGAGPKQALIRAAELHAAEHYRIMPSGAGHDAQILAGHLPTAMMFVPSIGGISHHWSENTSDADIGRGAEVFVEATKQLLLEPSGS